MHQTVHWESGVRAKHHSPIRWPAFLFLLFSFLPPIYGYPLFNESLAFNSTTENSDDLIDLIQQYTTALPNLAQPENIVHPLQLTPRQWRRLISRGPLITQVAFDIGPKFSPTYAYITSKSYNSYITDLGIPFLKSYSEFHCV